MLADLDDAQFEHTEALQKLAEIRAEKERRLKEPEDEFDAKLKEAGIRRDETQRRVTAANEAQVNLLRTAPKRLLTEAGDIRQRRIPEVADRLRTAERHVDELFRAVTIAQRRPQDRTAQEDAGFAQEQLPAAKAAVASPQERIEELKEAADEIDRRACYPWPEGIIEIQ